MVRSIDEAIPTNAGRKAFHFKHLHPQTSKELPQDSPSAFQQRSIQRSNDTSGAWFFDIAAQVSNLSTQLIRFGLIAASDGNGQGEFKLFELMTTLEEAAGAGGRQSR